MTSDDIIDALRRQKQQIEEHLPELLSRCQNDAERLALKGGFTASFLPKPRMAINGSGQVVGVRIDPKVVNPEDIETLQDEIAGMIARADDLGALLNKIATGITIGSKILMLVK